MQWDLPKEVKIDGKEYKIRNDCDYRTVLDTIYALTDEELPEDLRLQCGLYIFYEDLGGCTDIQKATDEMVKIINCGEITTPDEQFKPKIMDWKKDFKALTAPISRVLGYSVRDSKNYTHWYDFIGAYGEIGDCYFAHIISVRSKVQRGKKLDKSEAEFYREHVGDIVF